MKSSYSMKMTRWRNLNIILEARREMRILSHFITSAQANCISLWFCIHEQYIQKQKVLFSFNNPPGAQKNFLYTFCKAIFHVMPTQGHLDSLGAKHSLGVEIRLLAFVPQHDIFVSSLMLYFPNFSSISILVFKWTYIVFT